jgi:hypothetical protein
MAKEIQDMKITKWNLNILLYTFFITFLLGYVLAIYYPLIWNDNDDFGMSLISRGYFTGNPDNHLIFINSFIGNVLKMLYGLKSTTEWYSWLFVFFYSVANSIFVFIIFRKGFNSFSFIFLLSSLFLFLIKINTEYQFTILSQLLAQAGFFLYFLKLYENQESKIYTFIS